MADAATGPPVNDALRTQGFVALLRGPDHVFEFTNAAYEALVGRQGLIGRTVAEMIPDAREQGIVELLDKVFTTGKPHTGAATPVRVQSSPGGTMQERLVDFVYEPIRDLPDGVVKGIVVAGFDVTERVRAEESQKLLAREIHHRMKNGLAVILSLVRLTGRSARSVEEYKETLAARISAIDKTQDLLIQSAGDAVDLCDILRLELAPFLSDDHRVEISCPPMLVSARSANGFALIVHELFTNAVKYGALTAAGGTLSVDCADAPDGARLTWRETCAAPIKAGERGFGSTLIERVAADLSGRAILDFREFGLAATITFNPDAPPL